jgi:TMEM175 potassium channel family protein
VERATLSSARGRYPRGSEEFSRVLAFSDGLFAIAMTLLVVGITVPTLTDTDSVGELADALNDDLASFVSFFISFAVLGRYWIAHHAFFARLAAVDLGLIGLNLAYLLFIAFLPFPTGLLGNYFENPLSVVVYALSVAIVSGMEVVLYRHAYRRGLLARSMPAEVYRYEVHASLSPVVFFLLSVPVAFASTGVAVALWFGAVPYQLLFLERRKPAAAEEYF